MEIKTPCTNTDKPSGSGSNQEPSLQDLAGLYAEKLTKHINKQFESTEEREAAIRAAEETILKQLEERAQRQGKLQKNRKNKNNIPPTHIADHAAGAIPTETKGGKIKQKKGHAVKTPTKLEDAMREVAKEMQENKPSDDATNEAIAPPSTSILESDQSDIDRAEELARRLAMEVDWWCSTSGEDTCDDDEDDMESYRARKVRSNLSNSFSNEKIDEETNNNSKEEEEDRWVTHWSDEHEREYYFNPKTKAVVWDKPAVLSPGKNSDEDNVRVMDFTPKKSNEKSQRSKAPGPEGLEGDDKKETSGDRKQLFCILGIIFIMSVSYIGLNSTSNIDTNIADAIPLSPLSSSVTVKEARLVSEAKARAKAKEEARLAEIARKEEQARLAEEARLAEIARKAEEVRLAEEARLAEIARKAEEARIAKEARIAEELRLAEIARQAEEARLAEIARKTEEAIIAKEKKRKEKEEKAKLAEEARLVKNARKIEEAKIAEEARLAKEQKRQEEKARLAEEARLAEKARLAEQTRLAEEAQLAKEKKRREREEKARLVEEARLAEIARKEEEARLAKEKKRREEAARLAEEARLAEIARKKEEARIAEGARLAEIARKKEEARIAEEARLAEIARKKEEARIAEQARLAEIARKTEEARIAKEAKMAEEARLAEEERIVFEKKKKKCALPFAYLFSKTCRKNPAFENLEKSSLSMFLN